MAVDKLVDSAQLDADLTSVADAIRTRGGTSGQLEFPDGFVEAIEDIPSSGSADTLYEWAANTLTTYENTRLTSLRNSGMRGSGNALQLISLPNLETAGQHSFRENNCVAYYLPKLRTIGTACFQSSPNITVLVFPSWTNPGIADDLFRSCTALAVVDFGENATQIGRNNVFHSDTHLVTLIFRNSTPVILKSSNVFTNTPFASGGSGGTIYIPKSLYDHLGDGTALDYKAATNWSVFDGYGTITWAQIEGSQYENYYADGTPIT